MGQIIGTRIVLFKNISDNEKAPIYNARVYEDGKVVAEAGLWIATDKDSGAVKTDNDGNQYLSGAFKAPFVKTAKA